MATRQTTGPGTHGELTDAVLTFLLYTGLLIMLLGLLACSGLFAYLVVSALVAYTGTSIPFWVLLIGAEYLVFRQLVPMSKFRKDDK